MQTQYLIFLWTNAILTVSYSYSSSSHQWFVTVPGMCHLYWEREMILSLLPSLGGSGDNRLNLRGLKCVVTCVGSFHARVNEIQSFFGYYYSTIYVQFIYTDYGQISSSDMMFKCPRGRPISYARYHLFKRCYLVFTYSSPSHLGRLLRESLYSLVHPFSFLLHPFTSFTP